MATTLNLNIKGLDRRHKQFKEMEKRAKDLTPVWEVAHEAFMIEQKAQFETQGAHLLGSQWVPLSPEYAKRKPQPPAPFGILYGTGRLFRSMTDDADADHVFISRPLEAVMGSTVEYGKYHQKGGPRLPKRVIVKIRDAYRRVVTRAAIAWIVGGRRRGK